MAQQASGSIPNPEGDRMEVEEEARRKREREAEFYDTRGGENEQEEEGGISQEVAGQAAKPPQKKLDLDDIMATLQRSMAQNEAGFSKLDKEMTATKHEAREGKELAAKATTIANETKMKLEALERRVESLERNPGGVGEKTGPAQTRPQAPRAQNPQKRDRDYLGGDEGNTIVIGGFRNHADRDERRGEWEAILPKLTTELKEQIVETIVPPARSSIILVKTTKHANTEETRSKMLTWTQDFKALKLETKLEGEDRTRTLYATPSKPFSMRQRDAKFSQALEGLKIAAGDQKEHLNAEISRGKIFFDRIPLIERDPLTEEPIFHMNRISDKIPGLTRETLDEKILEAKRIRETERNT